MFRVDCCYIVKWYRIANLGKWKMSHRSGLAVNGKRYDGGRPTSLITVGVVPKSFFNAKKNKGLVIKDLAHTNSFKVLRHIESSKSL
jgi:hypothetical protein